MTTIQKGRIEYHIHAAPSTPLNLKMRVIYSPRTRDTFGGDFDGYSCVEVERGDYVVVGWGGGRTATLWEGNDLALAYGELARLLRLDVPVADSANRNGVER